MVEIGKMPSSCSDLQRMGHKLSGLYSVIGTRTVEMVYCNFYPNGKGIITTNNRRSNYNSIETFDSING
jgi:hypothetical protein